MARSKKHPPALAAFLGTNALDVLFNQAHDSICIFDLEGRFLEVNQTLVEKLGYSRDELLTMGFLPTVEDENSAFVAERFARAVGGETVHYSVTGVRKDGTKTRSDVTTAPLLQDGVPIAIIGVARDTDELETAHEERDAASKILNETLQSISEGLFLLDNDWRFVYVNSRGEEIAQRTQAELIGQSIWEAFPLMIGSEFGIGYRRARAENIKVVTRDRYEPYDVVLEATAYPTETVLAIYVRDVTEEERVAAHLAENDARLAAQAALLDSARDAIIVRGLDHVITYWNRAATDLYGWSAEEARGMSIREMMYPDPASFDKAVENLMLTGEWFGDIEQTARDGHTLIVEARWSLLRDDGGKPVSVLAVNTDVTQRRRQEEVILRTQRMESLGTLAGGIAHDLNNVLTPLLMSAQMLAAGETDPDKLKTLSVIETSAKRGADMMRQVLAFARGVEGRRIHVNTARLFSDLDAFCREALPATIRVKVDLPTNAWDSIGDPTQLLQVFVNLVTNAKDAMPRGGNLRVWARNVEVTAPFDLRLPGAGHYLCVHVEDSGSGMTPEVASKIFEPFFTTKGIGAGTGLGLATSMSIVSSHGGSMQVYTELGQGSRFDVYLPAPAPVNPIVEGEPRRQEEVPRGTGQLVLIVDDEPEIRHVARIALESYGYRTAVAGNGSEALSYLETFPGEAVLVFSDVTMPMMDGLTMVGIIDQLYPGLPVLLTSGLSVTLPDMDNSTGAREFIAKPYTAESLRSSVSGMLAGET